MKRISALLVIAAILTPTAASASPQQDLAQARAATAAFHNSDKAIAAGYIPTDSCVFVPGLGVMGEHWINPQYFTTDPAQLDPAHPQALLYVNKNGHRQLIAVEYIVFAPGATPAADPTQRDPNGPELFGVHFNGLMAGHEPGMPVHWDLHVWVWRHNPNGMFAEFNPSLSCS